MRPQARLIFTMVVILATGAVAEGQTTPSPVDLIPEVLVQSVLLAHETRHGHGAVFEQAYLEATVQAGRHSASDLVCRM